MLLVPLLELAVEEGSAHTVRCVELADAWGSVHTVHWLELALEEGSVSDSVHTAAWRLCFPLHDSANSARPFLRIIFCGGVL